VQEVARTRPTAKTSEKIESKAHLEDANDVPKMMKRWNNFFGKWSALGFPIWRKSANRPQVEPGCLTLSITSTVSR
jgi:hypothetical protein